MATDHKVDDGDKLAAAILAASRCVTMKQTDTEDYVAQYFALEKLFLERRAAEAQGLIDQDLGVWDKLAGPASKA